MGGDRLDPRLGAGLGEALDQPLGGAALALEAEGRSIRSSSSSRSRSRSCRSACHDGSRRRVRPPLPLGDARRPLLHALPRPRDQDRGRLVLVPDPLPADLLDVELLRRRARRIEHRDRRPSRSRSLSALGFFGSILLHELGHAFAALRNGIGISSIQLWILGGVARMDREADSPEAEFEVALAGPLVTLAIVVVLYLVGGIAAGFGEFGHIFRLAVEFKTDAGVSGVHLDDRLAGDDQRPDPRLQPAARLPDGRRPGRPRDRLVADRRPHRGDPLRRQPRPRLRLPLHRRRPRPGRHRRLLRRRLAGADRDGGQRLRPRRRDADRAHRARSARSASPT